VQINFDIPKEVPSLKTKPEVDFRLYGRYHEILKVGFRRRIPSSKAVKEFTISIDL